MKVTEDEVEVVVVSDVLSAGLENPNVKVPLEEVLSDGFEDPVPNTIPPLVPNLKPEPAAGCSDFLPSAGAVPNLNPSDEVPNVNPNEALLSLEVVSDEEPPNGIPNLNPPDDDDDDDEDVVSDNDPPNFKPPDPEELSDEPNLKPPDVNEPKLEPTADGHNKHR